MRKTSSRSSRYMTESVAPTLHRASHQGGSAHTPLITARDAPHHYHYPRPQPARSPRHPSSHPFLPQPPAQTQTALPLSTAAAGPPSRYRPDQPARGCSAAAPAGLTPVSRPPGHPPSLPARPPALARAPATTAPRTSTPAPRPQECASHSPWEPWTRMTPTGHQLAAGTTSSRHHPPPHSPGRSPLHLPQPRSHPAAHDPPNLLHRLHPRRHQQPRTTTPARKRPGEPLTRL